MQWRCTPRRSRPRAAGHRWCPCPERPRRRRPDRWSGPAHGRGRQDRGWRRRAGGSGVQRPGRNPG
ncbi:hypothetical protein FF041_21930 [Streptomyces jumonjinensis]|uniref:Uncharacterized protein n=1 Tax=Streptomyces jumonjinensis TaxID=1945 RepID=A0A646KKD5_STRJU|nr:hypothetical protein [Streptomyces jumonjinensis]